MLSSRAEREREGIEGIERGRTPACRSDLFTHTHTHTHTHKSTAAAAAATMIAAAD